MFPVRAFAVVLFASLTALSAADAAAKSKKGYHCEITKNGKTRDVSVSEIPNRKTCKAKGGKWVKAHDHSHDEGGEGHSHDEED